MPTIGNHYAAKVCGVFIAKWYNIIASETIMSADAETDPQFIGLVESAFSLVLQSRSFAKIAESFTPKSFGNAKVEFESQDMRLLVARDRGLVAANVLPVNVSREWDPVELIMEYFGVGLVGANSLDDQATFLATQYKRVLAVITSEYPQYCEWRMCRFERNFRPIYPA